MSKTPSIQVIDRMALLLNIMARYDDAVSLKILSAESELHPSTAFRILASLAKHQYVERDDSGYYRLGIKLLHLGSHVRQRVGLSQQAKPIMRKLRDELGETINLTIRENDEVVYVERCISSQMMRVEQVIGSRAPLHVTAVGKLMLAEAGEEECRQYAQRTGLPAYTENTITDIDDLISKTKQAKINGYAYDNEEAEKGVGCIGVLIYNNAGDIAGGLSLSAPIERRKEEWIPIIIEAGKRLSESLGYFG
ncbi:IclR family transcriptional regulator [Sulfuriflexus mobilis]|uniref:IclR family transcriptional regulator n=1 Tax=Sulfuriflexus mobilis TaxID=1811807 RepID=UPI000F84E243|nr:IclR family transcriptional regulator [Sulfuriflexus mobilis]